MVVRRNFCARGGKRRFCTGGPFDDRAAAVKGETQTPVGGKGILCEAVHKTYVSGDVRTPVLRALTLAIPAGEFVVVLGPSGCGKTTVLNLLGALDRPDTGKVMVDGLDVAALGDRERVRYRAKDVGFIFQFYNLLPTLTAMENVEIGLEPLGLSLAERGRRAREFLVRVGLEHRLNQFPSQLSGGEQQRVAVARALARRPKIVLADEPTGNLDEETGMKVFELMRTVQRELGCTQVVVTHNVALADLADRSIHMRDGRVAE